jgi:hypothetical protein
MLKKLLFILLGAASIVVQAASYPPSFLPLIQDDSSWHYSLGGGDTHYSDMFDNDGSTVFGRLSVSRDIKVIYGSIVGLELGVQTSSDMRLHMNPTQYFDLGEAAVQTFFNPMADLLVTTSKSLNAACWISGFIKAGIAFRQMHFDRDSMNDKRQVSPELQVGISKKISDKASIAIGYQGIFSGKIGLVTNNPTAGLGQGTGTVKNIPSQQGVLFTLTMSA